MKLNFRRFLSYRDPIARSTTAVAHPIIDHPLAKRPRWRLIESEWSYEADGIEDRSPPSRSNPGLIGTRPMLNLGCGSHHHPAWINLDIGPSDADVIAHNLLEPLPFVDQTFGVVYHSHVLEHLPKGRALAFSQECFRVTKPGGLIRIAIPDLEKICRLYLEFLDGAMLGEEQAARRYDWIVIELLDQMARQRSGGEMLEYWRQNPMPEGDFVFERVGQEAKNAIAHIRAAEHAPQIVNEVPTAEQLGTFRLAGEVHLWMYDRFSLGRLLAEAGFCDPVVCQAHESAVDGFEQFGLDTMPDGSVRKPDSLFMEARRPP